MKYFSQKATAIALFATLGAAVVSASGNGSSPNGKPFVAINGQIVEVTGAITSLQDQIDALVARVDTVEQRVAADQEAIATLQNQSDALEALIQQNLTDIASIEAKILEIQQANADLQAQIAAYSGDMETLQAQVAANSALITTLQSAILLVQNDVISLESGLQAQIDNNNILIQFLQAEIDEINETLALKQNLVNGICPDGSAAQQILPDGSVVCEVFAGTSGQLEVVTSYNDESGDPGDILVATAYCPADYIISGAGFISSTGLYLSYVVTAKSSYNGNDFAQVGSRNNTTLRHYLTAQATCIRIAP